MLRPLLLDPAPSLIVNLQVVYNTFIRRKTFSSTANSYPLTNLFDTAFAFEKLAHLTRNLTSSGDLYHLDSPLVISIPKLIKQHALLSSKVCPNFLIQQMEVIR